MKRRKLDNITITVDAVEDAFKQHRLSLLEKHGLEAVQTIEENGVLSDKLIHTVRICRMTDKELYSYDLSSLFKVISPYNEFVTYLYLKRVLREMGETTDLDQGKKLVLERAQRNAVSSYKTFCDQNRPQQPPRKINNENASTDETFIKWCTEAGVIINSVEIGCFEGIGRGLMATRSLPSDHAIINLPRRVVLCVKTAIEYDTVYAALKQAEVDDDAIVTLFLMREKGKPDSYWRRYFDSLPTSMSTYPLYLSDEAITVLEGTSLYEEVHQAKERMNQFVDVMFPFLFEHFPDSFSKQVFKYENLIWARMIIESRAFSFPELGCCLLPLIDHVNTSFYPQIESRGYYRSDSDSIELVTMHDCKQGEHLSICYGPYSNRELLNSYGFMTDDNFYDCFAIDFEIPPDDTLENQKIKLRVLEKHQLSVGNHFFVKGALPLRMLAVLRICLANEKDMEKILEDQFDPFHPICDENEVRVRDTIRMTLESLLEMVGEVEDVEGGEDIQTVTKFKSLERQIIEVSLAKMQQ
jgi:hypothetical protein